MAHYRLIRAKCKNLYRTGGKTSMKQPPKIPKIAPDDIAGAYFMFNYAGGETPD